MQAIGKIEAGLAHDSIQEKRIEHEVVLLRNIRDRSG